MGLWQMYLMTGVRNPSHLDVGYQGTSELQAKQSYPHCLMTRAHLSHQT